MSYNTKNYTEQGGDKTVIGGSLEIKEGAEVIGLSSSSEITPASKTKIGGIKANSKAETDTVEVKIEVIKSFMFLLTRQYQICP